MKHVWSVFCRHMVEDKRTGNPSLIDITERIGFRGDLPGERPINLPFPFPFFIVSKWSRNADSDLGNYKARVRWLSPDGDELRTIEHELGFGERGANLHHMVEVQELQYLKNGTYQLEVAYLDNEDWIKVASIPLDIVHEEPETEQHESEPTE